MKKIINEVYLEVNKNSFKFIIVIFFNSIMIGLLFLLIYNINLQELDAKKYIDNFPKNEILISGEFDEDDLFTLNSLDFVASSIGYKTSKIGTIKNSSDNVICEEVSVNFDGVCLSNDSLSYLQENKLIAGRYFSKNDIILNKKVCIIPNIIYKKIYGNSFSYGQMLNIDDIQYEIIGILYDTPDVIRTNLINENNSNNEKAYIIYFLSFSNNYDSISIRVKEDLNSNNTDFYIKEIQNKGICIQQLDLYWNDLLKLESTNGSYQFLNIIVSVIMLIILIVSFFVQKDKIYSLAIKKCFGAKFTNMFNEILIENLYINLISGILGLLLGIYISISMSINMYGVIGELLLPNILNFIFIPPAINLFLSSFISIIIVLYVDKANVSNVFKA